MALEINNDKPWQTYQSVYIWQSGGQFVIYPFDDISSTFDCGMLLGEKQVFSPNAVIVA